MNCMEQKQIFHAYSGKKTPLVFVLVGPLFPTPTGTTSEGKFLWFTQHEPTLTFQARR